MKAIETPYQQFKKETDKHYDILLKQYKEKIDLARDGFEKNVHDEFYNNTNKSFQTIQEELGNYSHEFIFNIEEEVKKYKNKEFEIEFNSKFSVFENKDKERILNNLAVLKSYLKLHEYLQIEAIKYSPQVEIKNDKTTSNIQWLKDNKTEFTHFIYALFHGGYLSNKEKEKTKLVEEIAKLFNIELSENWQSNLSKSILKSKNGYEPEIFNELKKEFEKYYTEIINKDK